MTHNLSFRYHADITTKVLGLRLGVVLGLRLGLGSAKVEVLQKMYGPLKKNCVHQKCNVLKLYC